MAIGCAFIVGCPRSGTTLLQSLLASHESILSFPESKFFVHLFPARDEPKWRLYLGLGMRRTRPQSCLFLKEIGHPDLSDRLPSVPFLNSYTRFFVNSLDEVTRRNKKSFWIEKTPDHLAHIHYIDAAIPQAKFIHIVRSGRDVVASLYDLSQRYPDFWGKYFPSLDVCIERWVSDIAITHKYSAKSRHYVVSYADLTANPSETIDEVFKFLCLESEPNLFANYTEGSSHLLRKREAWKADVGKQITNAEGKKFMKVFTPKQQEYVLQRIAGVSLPNR